MLQSKQKYQELFLTEAQEHLDSLDSRLIDFEKSPQDAAVVKELMRHAHTLKGIAASMGYGDISNLAHSFEGMVENMKNHLAKGGTDMLFGALDELRMLVKKTSSGSGRQSAANPLIDEVGELEKSDILADEKTIDSPETFRMSSHVKVRTDKLDRIMDLTAELMVNTLRLNESAGIQDIHTEALEKNARLVEELQYQSLTLRLIPIEYVFNRFPRMIRDLAKKEGKEIDIHISGGDIELDRQVIEDLGEPLVHLLRNAVDHGIEKKGTISLSAQREKDQVRIIIGDDGTGIDWQQLKKKRQSLGLPAADSPDDLLFSGISTTEHVSEISGRGIGLSVVKQTIEELGGTITVVSPLPTSHGTEFHLHLPISLAVVKALLIRIDNQRFAVPIANIERLIRLSSVQETYQTNTRIAVIAEQEVPLLDMRTLLGLREIQTAESASGDHRIALLVRIKNALHGAIIDTVETEQDIIVKPISRSLRGQVPFSASTLLGDGKPVPILDIESLIVHASDSV